MDRLVPETRSIAAVLTCTAGLSAQGRVHLVTIDVAAFYSDDEINNDVAYPLVMNGFVTKFWDENVLARTLSWLDAHGYQLVDLDASESRDITELIDRFAVELRFPEYFGHNLDALNDCLRDVAAGDYGVKTDAAGLVLVLRHFDVLSSQGAAVHVLDIIADRCRGAALIGRRMMCLLQSDDAQFDLPPLGGRRPEWNTEERLNGAREH